jgi:thiol:disulfide interchange protein DsbC
MKRILSGAMMAFLFCAVATVAFSASAAKTVARKSPGTPPDTKLIHNCASCHTLSKEEAGTIFKGLGEVTEVKTSPVKGLYEVTVRQKNRQAVAYLDFSKKLLVPGPVFDIVTKRTITPPPVELPKILSKADLEKIPLTNSIVMGNPGGKKRIIVFTDPDCPFCGKLHTELKKLVSLEPDLAVYIKMYPLDTHPGAYDKARVILGSKSLELLEKAFEGEKLSAPGEKDAKEPVDETLKLGEALGVEGTPALILPGGRMISGSRDAKALQGLLAGDK